MRLILAKIVHRIFLLFFAEKYSQSVLKADIENLGFRIQIGKVNWVLCQKGTQQTITLRKGTSDIPVFSQIFVEKEYQPLLNFFVDNSIGCRTIIDCGANIGLSSLQFHKYFPNAEIVALEAVPETYACLQKNTQEIPAIKTLNQAIWHTDETVFLDNSFRDGAAWSMAVSSPGPGRNSGSSRKDGQGVEGISFATLLDGLNWNSVDLLKMDIEGGERFIFSDTADLSFLNRVGVLAIEIHDEFNIRRGIYTILRNAGFVWFNVNETTIAVKKSIWRN